MSYPHDRNNPGRDYSDDEATRAFSQVPPEEEPTIGYRPPTDPYRSAYGQGYDNTHRDSTDHAEGSQGYSHAPGPGDSPVTRYQQAQEHISDLEHDKLDLEDEVQQLKPFKAWTIALAILTALLLLLFLWALLFSGNREQVATVGENGQPTVTQTQSTTLTETRNARPPETITQTQTETATKTETATQTQTTSVTVTPGATPGTSGEEGNPDEGQGLFGRIGDAVR